MVGEVNIKISGEGADDAKVTTKKEESNKKNASNRKPTKKKTTTKKSTKKKKSTTKKSTKKKTTKKRKSPTTKKTSQSEKILIENFTAMQKVMTTMAEKFDNLSTQMSKLLKLFEDSAETLVEKDINLQLGENEDHEELLEKLNRVLDQNKIIAKGLTLMHETAVNPNTHYSLTQPKNEPETHKATPLQKPNPPMPKTQTKEAPEMTMSRPTPQNNSFTSSQQPTNEPKKQKVFEEDEDTFAGY